MSFYFLSCLFNLWIKDLKFSININMSLKELLQSNNLVVYTQQRNTFPFRRYMGNLNNLEGYTECLRTMKGIFTWNGWEGKLRFEPSMHGKTSLLTCFSNNIEMISSYLFIFNVWALIRIVYFFKNIRIIHMFSYLSNRHYHILTKEFP